MISQEGRVKVADLGLLKNLGGLSRTNSFVGTASFMSPERLEGSSYDTSADIWSLGISLITIATGLLPPGYKDGFWSILQVRYVFLYKLILGITVMAIIILS